jgi:hypothetical protein
VVYVCCSIVLPSFLFLCMSLVDLLPPACIL